MSVNIWKFRVKNGCEGEFLDMNEKDWPDLFRKSSGYKGTAVYEGKCRVYLTVDEWEDKSFFDKIVEQYKTDYEYLSSQHHALCEEIKHVGWCTD